MNWRFLDTGTADGSFNMAVDEALVEECRTGRSRPVLRVYRWEPWTLSLGRMEDASRRLDLAACRRDGIPVVRRPTGGRTVFHADELTYSVIARPSDLPVDATVRALYRFVSGALVEALRSLGVPAEVWPPEDGGPRSRLHPRECGSGAGALRGHPCFASVSQYEICAEGKKLVGSAQRTWSDVMLQHGSILLGPAHCRIENYQKEVASPGALAKCTTSVSQILGRPADADGLSRALLAAARRVWNAGVEEGCLSEAELESARMRVDAKYGTDDWNLRKGLSEADADAPAAGGH
jgi:lipoate-protein ligase A